MLGSGHAYEVQAAAFFISLLPLAALFSLLVAAAVGDGASRKRKRRFRRLVTQMPAVSRARIGT